MDKLSKIIFVLICILTSVLIYVSAGPSLAADSTVITYTATLDGIPPSITITSPQDGLLTNEDVTLVYTVYDVGPLPEPGPNETLITVTVSLSDDIPEGITVEGDESPYTADGFHEVTLTATDQAGNSATDTVSFTIDKTSPVIEISGVSDGAYYNEDVTPIIEITDPNLDGAPTTLNGAPYVSGTPVTAEGDYILAAEATDLAGNSSSESVSFTIDKTAPVITIPSLEDELITNEDVTLNYTVTDLTEVSITGPESGTAYSEEGEYTVEISATDQAGNSSSESVSFTIDKTAPVTTILSSEDELITNEDVTLVYTAYDPGPPLEPGPNEALLNINVILGDAVAEDITVEGDESPYTADGFYEVTLTATDQAGNSSSESVSFTIDKTAPVITIPSPEDELITNEDVILVYTVYDVGPLPEPGPNETLITVTVSLSDDIPEGITVEADESPYTADGFHEVTLTATDRAGNSATDTVFFTIDKTPPDIAITSPEGGGLYVATRDRVIIDFGIADVLDPHPVVTASYLTDVEEGTRLDVTAGQEIEPRDIDDGQWTFTVEAKDWADNTSSLATDRFEVIWDIKPPRTTISPGTPQYSTDLVYVTSATEFILDVVDDLIEVGDGNGLGIDYTEYRIDAGPWIQDSGPFTVGTEGEHTIECRSGDVIGNTEEPGTLSLIVDDTAPGITITGITEGAYYNYDVTPLIGLSDPGIDGVPGSGVATHSITLNGITFASGTIISAEDEYTLTAQATDELGNSASQNLTFTIDKTPPEITITSPQAGLLTKDDVTLQYDYSDDLSPVADIVVIGDEGPYAEDGDYTVIITVTDEAGNPNTATISFRIDKTPPTFTIVATPDPSSAGEVTISVLASEPLSSISSLKVTDDAGRPVSVSSPTINGLLYTYIATITESTAEGTAYISIGGNDIIGNLGTGGDGFVVDLSPLKGVIVITKPQ